MHLRIYVCGSNKCRFTISERRRNKHFLKSRNTYIRGIRESFQRKISVEVILNSSFNGPLPLLNNRLRFMRIDFRDMSHSHSSMHVFTQDDRWWLSCVTIAKDERFPFLLWCFHLGSNERLIFACNKRWSFAVEPNIYRILLSATICEI